MRRYKVNKALYMIIPLFVLLNAGFYILVLYKKSIQGANIVNLLLDGLVVLYYLTKFCYEVSIDSEGVNFYLIFSKKRVKKGDIYNIRQSVFLTRVECKGKSFYIPTTRNGRDILKAMFKDVM